MSKIIQSFSPMENVNLPFRILAVDPATTLSGWSLLVLESINPLIIRIEAVGEIDGSKLLKTRKEMSQIFQKQFCTLDAIEEIYTSLVVNLKPDIVVSEGSFGFIHLSALIALTLAINVLRRVSRNVLNKDIVEIPPTISKLAFTGIGSANKELMREYYDKADYLIKSINRELSEHEIDSISHGCAFIKRDILKTVIQISAKDKRKRKKDRQS